MDASELYDFRFFLKEKNTDFGKQVDFILAPLKQLEMNYEILNNEWMPILRLDNYFSVEQCLALLVEAKRNFFDMSDYYDGAIFVVTTMDLDLGESNCLNREWDVSVLRMLVDLNIGFGYTVQL